MSISIWGNNNCHDEITAQLSGYFIYLYPKINILEPFLIY